MTTESVSLEAEPKRPRGSGRRRGRRPGLIPIILLSVALAAVIAAFVVAFIKLGEATTLIEEQQQQLDKQEDLIDGKETFGVAMTELLETAKEFDGVRMSALVPLDNYQAMADLGWAHRWNLDALQRDTESVNAARAELRSLLDSAATAKATNTTGTTYESVIDALGYGFVTSLIDDADSLCNDDVLACVLSSDSYTVHFDAADSSLPYMTDWLRTGLAYHEFAHVLQMTNDAPTATALESFGGDHETMADCFALTYLDGWTLDHRIWVSTVQYWDVSIGYGYTCNATQRAVIRTWYEGLGVQVAPITQR